LNGKSGLATAPPVFLPPEAIDKSRTGIKFHHRSVPEALADDFNKCREKVKE
jgi:hypothetical protein